MLEQASGPRVDVRFIAMMSVHHAQAIGRARADRRSRLHPPVSELTGDIIRSQRREGGQLQEWLVTWHANELN